MTLEYRSAGFWKRGPRDRETVRKCRDERIVRCAFTQHEGQRGSGERDARSLPCGSRRIRLRATTEIQAEMPAKECSRPAPGSDGSQEGEILQICAIYHRVDGLRSSTFAARLSTS